MKKTSATICLIMVVLVSLIVQAVFTLPAYGYEIVGWGSQKTPNDPLTNITKIAAGYRHSLALKSDGTIVGWGLNDCGQATTPDGNDFTAIAAGMYHSLALKSDGTIVGWGDNSWGQATPPEGNDFIAITAGHLYSLALKSDGSIIGWGINRSGQATSPAGNDFTAIAAGGQHSLALKSDGTLVGWGDNEYGQATPPDGNSFIAIAAGWSYSLALKSDGSIVGWGYNNYGQTTPPAGNNFIAIAAGGTHSLALKSDGTIVGWGTNWDGESTPPAGNDFMAVAAGGYYSLALRNNPPVADAGSDQMVYAGIDGKVKVVLDGSDSNDADGDELTYKWTWTIDANTYEANSVSPTIELPVGVHTIQLMVNDGLIDSAPDDVNVTVIAPLEGRLNIVPSTINRRSNQPEIRASIKLPCNITKSDVDFSELLVLYPGEIKATSQQVLPAGNGSQKLNQIAVSFDKTALMNAVPAEGNIELKVAGKLKTGQYFYGCDTVRIIGPKW
jgi:hypothetical protein